MAPAKNVAPKKTSKKSPVEKTDSKTASASPIKKESIDPIAPSSVDEAGPSSVSVPDGVSNTRSAVAQPSFANLSDQYLVIVRRIEKDLRDVRALGKKLQQVHNKEVKQLQSAIKTGGRRRRNVPKDPNAPKRTPKGIAGPGPLSSELAAFLQVEPDTLLARTEVIKRLAAYIKTENLQNPQDKRLIVPDKALEQLLKFPPNFDEPISYFNLQRLLKHHYPNNTSKSEVRT